MDTELTTENNTTRRKKPEKDDKEGKENPTPSQIHSVICPETNNEGDYVGLYLRMRRVASNSPVRNFVLIIYLLYFRYTVEFGISLLSYPEAFITNVILCIFFFSMVNQGSRLVFNIVLFLIRFVKVMVWALKNMDKVDIK